jgi:hypothetical protein
MFCLWKIVFLIKISSVRAAESARNQEFEAREKAFRERSKQFQQDNKIV